jgi:hypothetical protein
MHVLNAEMFRNDNFDPHHGNNQDDYQWYVILKVGYHEVCRIPVQEWVPFNPSEADKIWAAAQTLREYFSGDLSEI